MDYSRSWDRLHQRAARLKGNLFCKLKQLIYGLAYRGFIPRRWAATLIAHFWENLADAIHAQWGSETRDHTILSDIIARYKPNSLLDAGCGSGRLFRVYLQCGVAQVTGLDISAHALEIARRSFPTVHLHQVRLQDLEYPPGTFDLGICNRVLQHIPRDDIQAAIHNLVRVCRLVYVNEMTQSDDVEELFYMKRYDYLRLFEEVGFDCLENGHSGKQTYFVFGHRESVASGTRTTRQ